MFEQSMVGRDKGARTPLAVACSSLAQVVAIALMIVVPLLSTTALPSVVIASLLQAPGVPPPPPSVAVEVVRPRTENPRPFVTTALMQPSSIPEEVAMIVDDAPPMVDPRVGVRGATGPRDGVPGGVINSILQSTPMAAPPPPAAVVEPVKPAAPRKTRRVTVGGEVQAPVLLYHAKPVYPRLAVQTRTEGTVRLRAVIRADGSVANLQLVSGHPLLVQAALNAVRQWRYQPTRLNGEPVEVAMQVDVNFRLGPR